MNSLITYESSDDEEVETTTAVTNEVRNDVVLKDTAQNDKLENPAVTIAPVPSQSRTSTPEAVSIGPLPGPTLESIADIADDQSDTIPLSPYSYERRKLHELTLPAAPELYIPASPSAPAHDSDDARRLAATTKKFNKFLELKKQGTHFHAKLDDSISLRNPSLLPKLMEFAGISREDSYASTLPDDIAVPVNFHKDFHIESLVQENERQERNRISTRDRIEFVPSTSIQQTDPRASKRHAEKSDV